MNNQIEFQYSQVRFADKFKNHINNSNNILLVLNTQLSHFVGRNNYTEYAECISGKITKKIIAKYFILACGGIENSRILLWTRDKNQEFIDNDFVASNFSFSPKEGLDFSGFAIVSQNTTKIKSDT